MGEPVVMTGRALSSATLARAVGVAAAVVALAGCSSGGAEDAPGAAGASSPSSSVGAAPSASDPGSASSAGQAGSTGTRPAGSPSTSASGGGVDRCHTSELTGRLVPGDAGAGQRHATLVLTDTGGRTCTIEGFGGLGLVDAQGRALPTEQVRSGPAGGPVTLGPGGTVSAQLSWSAVPGAGDAQSGDCQPTAAALQVIPPGETDSLRVDWTAGPVCEAGTIRQTAYVAG
ncbi:DUF4232 domain-containing protein [Modestobacter lacusdianchii]